MELELINVDKAFSGHVVFKNLNFDFSKCGLYVISGKSGCGKSTLLNILAGYENIDAGKRCVDSSVLIACIFQSYELIEELNVYDNIYLTKDRSLSFDFIEELGLTELLSRYPKELSQGQKQRVGIARALACCPQVIICDEPTESLDIENKERVLNLLKKLSQDCVVIVATHDISMLQDYADYQYVIEDNSLILQTPKQQAPTLTVEERKTSYHELKRIIHQMIHKRTMIQTLFLSLLIIFQIITFQINGILFQEKTSYQVINQNSLYVKTNGMNPDSLYKYGEIRPILNFDTLNLNNKIYKMNIYPLPTTSQNQLKDNQILINQNTAKVLMNEWQVNQESLINHQILLSYQMGSQIYQIECTIKDIIEEDLKDVKQIYYSYDGINSLLKQKRFSKEYPTQYDYLMKKGESFEIQCSSTQVQDYYQVLKGKSKLTVNHSIFTSLHQNQGQKDLYYVLFMIVQIILLAVSIIYIVYMTYQDTKKNQVGLSIIHASGVDLQLIKKRYFIEKLKYLLIVFISALFVCLILEWQFHQTKRSLICGLFVGVILCLYVLIFYIRLSKLHKNQISILLKDNKDE